MAIMHSSSVVGGISGKLGGVVFVNARSSTVVRHRPPNRPRSSAALVSQQAVFANVTKRWRTISNADRESWRSLAKNMPQTNRLGESSPLSGFALFVKANLISRRWFGGDLSAPPTFDNRMTFNGVILEATAPSTATALLAIENDDEPTTAQIMGFRPFSATLPKFRQPWREVFLDNFGPIPPKLADFGDGWNAVYGPLVAGEAILIAVRVLNPRSELFPSVAIQQSTIVLAP